MARAMRLVGVTLAVAAATVIAGGTAGLASLASAVLAILPVAAIGYAVILVVRSAMPPGSADLPLALVALGGLALWWRLTPDTGEVARHVAAALLLGGVILVHRPRRLRRIDSRTLVRVRRIGFGKDLLIAGTAPVKLSVLEVGATVTIDYREARHPGVAGSIHVDLTMVCGRVDIRIPDDWVFAAGRVITSASTKFDGNVKARLPDAAVDEDGDVPLTIVLNVLAVGGEVAVNSSARPAAADLT